MNLGWVLLALVGWALGLIFVLILMRMSGEQDRAGAASKSAWTHIPK